MLPPFRLGAERSTSLVILGRGAGRSANPYRIWEKVKLGAMQTPDGRSEDSAPDALPGTQSRETEDQDETRETSRREEPQNFATARVVHHVV